VGGGGGVTGGGCGVCCVGLGVGGLRA
jgi:hypothetical protein